MSRNDDLPDALFPLNIGDRGLEVVGYDLLDLGDLQAPALLDQLQVSQSRPGQADVDVLLLDRGLGLNLDQGPLQFPDVGIDLGSNVVQGGFIDFQALGFSLLAQDGDPRLQVRRRDLDLQASGKAGNQAL